MHGEKDTIVPFEMGKRIYLINLINPNTNILMK